VIYQGHCVTTAALSITYRLFRLGQPQSFDTSGGFSRFRYKYAENLAPGSIKRSKSVQQIRHEIIVISAILYPHIWRQCSALADFRFQVETSQEDAQDCVERSVGRKMSPTRGERGCGAKNYSMRVAKMFFPSICTSMPSGGRKSEPCAIAPRTHTLPGRFVSFNGSNNVRLQGFPTMGCFAAR
jgi:hypothetical protein